MMKRNTKLLISASIFIVTFLVGLSVHEQFELPFSNPWGITGPLTVIKYNPINDIIRFIFLIAIPSFILVVFCLNSFTKDWFITESPIIQDFNKIENDKSPLKAFLYLLVFSFLFIVAGNAYLYHNFPLPLDTYHEGETLGMAVDYLNGKIPYRDTMCFHGVFQDPLRSVLAFKIFGKSIAAVRTFESILNIIILVLFCISLYYLFGKNIYYGSLSIFFLSVFLIQPFGASGVRFQIANRDIGLLVFIIIATLIQKDLKTGNFGNNRLREHTLLFLFTLVPALSLSYSIERGLFLGAVSIIYSTAIYFMYLRKIDFKYIFPVLAGYVLGIVVLGFAIRWAYRDFFKFALVIMPQYVDLMHGYVYPFTKSWKYLIPVLLISINLYWLVYRFINFCVSNRGSSIENIKVFYMTYFMEILLLVVCIFYFSYALGRSDTGHVRFASCPIFMLTIYFLIKHYLLPLVSRMKWTNQITFGASCLILAILMISYIPRINFGQWYKFPLGIPDEKIIPRNYIETISFLKRNLNDNEGFFTMTSEAIWYYFIDRPCPTKFLIVWLAVPYFYQDELVEDLREKKIKFILYKNSHWANAIDGFTNEMRLKIVSQYIKENYIFFKRIDDNEIWVRRSREK